MQKSYSALDGQSIFDVCLQVYGSLDFLFKLIQDSGIDSVNSVISSQQQFIYDDTLVFNQGVSNQFLLSGIFYATDSGNNGEVYYIIKQPPPLLIKGPTKLPPNNNNNNMPYQRVSHTTFISGADGTVDLFPLDKDSLSMVGYDIVEVILEIKPLKNSDYVWNKTIGKMSLQGGIVVDKDQQLSILYSQFITP